MIFFRINLGRASLDGVPLAGSDLKLDLVLYRVTNLVLKTHLRAKLLHAFSRALLQSIRVLAEYFENLPFLGETFPLFNDHSFDGRMWLFCLDPFFELTDVLAFLRQEIEVSLKVGVNHQDSLVVMGDSPQPDCRLALVSLMVEV